MKYLYTTLLDSQYISNKSIWTVKYILSQVFILCIPHVNANLLHIMLESVAHLCTTWPEFHWWSLSCVSVVWCKPNALLSAYSDSNIFSATSMGLYTRIMHSQNDSLSSWLQYFTIFTISLWLILTSDSTVYPGFESCWGRDILHPFRMAPRSNHPSVQLEFVLFPGNKVDRVWCPPPTPSRAAVEYG
jgi:hypothetical protein